MNVLQNIFRVFVPELTQRIPITWKTFPMTQIHYVPLIYMAYLARKPNTYHTRLLLLSLLVALTIHAGFGYKWVQPQFEALNWLSSYTAMVCIAKGVEYASVKDRLRKLTEIETTKKATTNGSHLNGAAGVKDVEDRIEPWYLEGIEVISSFRGIGWEHGRDIHIPRDTRPQEKVPFLRHTAIYLLEGLLLYDFLSSCLELVPGLKDGGTIWLPSLSPLPRYVLSTIVVATIGNILITSMDMCNYIFALLAVGILNQSPSVWPPIFDNPWASESVHELWSKRWHQLLRQMFLALGSYPGRLIAGRFGFVMGAFLISAYWHEFGFYMFGQGWDNRMVFFFVFQGFLIIAETLYKRVTGKRVSGWLGRILVYCDMMILTQPMINSVFTRGSLKTLTVPLIISPTKRVLWPLVSLILPL